MAEIDYLEGLGYIPLELKREARTTLKEILKSDILASFVQSTINNAKSIGLDLDQAERSQKREAYRRILKSSVFEFISLMSYLATTESSPAMLQHFKDITGKTTILLKLSLDLESKDGILSRIILDLIEQMTDRAVKRHVDELRARAIPPFS